MAAVQLMQTDLTYNITTDDNEEYTVLIMEDFFSGCFSSDIYDDNEELVEDDEKIIEIMKLIEDRRS